MIDKTNDERRIVYLPLAELMTRLHPQNPKSHDLGAIIESYCNHGYVASGVLDDRTGLFLAGHGRIQALSMMKKQGMTGPDGIRIDFCDWLVPVQVGYSSENDTQALAYIVADNKLTTLGGWDEPALAELLQDVAASTDIALEATGFSGDDLDLLLADLGMIEEPPEDPGAQVDRAAELQEKWQVERGDVWQVGKHRIMCGDSTCAEDVGLLMDRAKAEMLFTSPPYSDQREYSGNDLSVETLAKFIPTWKQFCNFQCVNLGLMRKENEITQYWDAYISVARESGLKLLAWNIWDKINATSVQSQMHMFALSHEFIFVFGIAPKAINRTLEKSPESKKREKNFRLDSYGRKVTTRRQKNGSVKESHIGESYDKKQLNSVLPCYAEMARNVEHPAKFPPELVVAYTEAMTDESQIVCDPFLGSGTTLVACEQTGRVGYGMEISPEYVSVSLERLQGLGLTPQRTASAEQERG